MFDLFRRKDTNLRILLGVLLGIIALSMVITLIPGFGSSGFGLPGTGEEAVAKVCGEPVTTREVRIKLQQMLNRTQLPPDSAAIFIPQFIDQLVSVKGVACVAQEMGMIATDEAVAKKIQKDVPQFWQNGKFIGKDMYAYALKQSGISVQEFEDSVRKEVATTRLRTLMVLSSVATPAEVETAFREAEEAIKLEYTVIDLVDIAKSNVPSEAAIQAYFNEKGKELMTPEYQKVNMMVFDPQSYGQRLEVTEQQIQRFYSDNVDSFRMPERSKVRHILFKTQGKPEAEDAKMKSLAETVFKQIQGGANFADLAKKYSEDPGSKDNGGNIDFITKGQTVKAFEETSFNAPLKTLTGPVKTEFGYHLIEVLERTKAQQLPLEQVKPQIIQEIRRQYGADALGRAADQLRRDAEKTPSEAANLATKAGAMMYSFEYQGAGTVLPMLGPKPDLQAAIQRLKKGAVSEPQVVDGKTVLFQVYEVLPRRQMTLAEARSQISGQLQSQIAQKKLEELRQKAIAEMPNIGGDIAKLGKILGTPVKTTQLFSRLGYADGIGPSSSVIAGFAANVGTTWGPFTVDGKWFVAKVIEKKAADMSLLPARRAELVNQVKNKKAGERNDIFDETLMRSLEASGRIKINETVKKRLASNTGA
jgi:peptidyl-prolyl cis-trans isomerase D